MPVPDSKVLQVCDAAVLRIDDAWDPEAPDEVSREYLIPVDVDTLTGRKVYVFPASYATQPADREDDQNDCRVAVLVVEKYTGEGQPPKDWLDERTVFVEQKIWRLLTDPQTVELVTASTWKFWPEQAEIKPVYDLEQLDKRKVFWSEVEILFREVTD